MFSCTTSAGSAADLADPRLGGRRRGPQRSFAGFRILGIKGVHKLQGAASLSARLVRKEALAVRVQDRGGDRGRLLVVKPTKVVPIRYTAEQLESVGIGTESHLAFNCGG